MESCVICELYIEDCYENCHNSLFFIFFYHLYVFGIFALMNTLRS